MSASILPAFDALRREVEEQLRPLAKTKAQSPRDSYISKSHAAFVEAVDFMLGERMSKRQIAREMDMDVHTLIDVHEGKRKLQGWMIAALPARGRAVFIRAALGWQDERRDGTNG